MRTQTVVFVLFGNVQSLDVTGPLEVLAGANSWLAAREREPAYQLGTAGADGEPVRTSSGLWLTPDRALADVESADLLVVPGGPGAREVEPTLIEWLRRRAQHARRVISVCTGAFLLAEAGLLAGREATTHWSHSAELAREFPEVDVTPEPIFVNDGALATSAGVTAGIDLALALVEADLGREAALEVARHLVVFLRRPGNQAQFSTQLAAQVAERAPLRELQRWISEHPAEDLSVDALAGRANLSPRQFARAFAAEVGMTPGRYVDKVRLESARRALEDGTEGVERTARVCGFGTPEAMRRAFLRAVGVSPAEYRRRFQSAVPSQ